MATSEAKKILVIDDDPQFLSSLMLALQAAGYEPLAANDGDDGLSIACERTDIHAVILDLAMPRVGGFQVLVDLENIRPRLPVLAITSAYGDQHLEVAGYLGAASA